MDTGYTDYDYEKLEIYKGQKLSEIIKKDEKAFAIIATQMVDSGKRKFQKYRKKCEENIDYWKNNHWNNKDTREENEPQPNVPVIHSTVENCVADSMDNYPTIIIRGVNGDDDLRATIMTEALRFTTQRSNHIQKYEKTIRGCHIVGAGVRQTFWNQELANGLGDIDYRYINIKDFAWDPSVEDIDDGMFVGVYDYISDEAFNELYPDVDLKSVKARTRGDSDEQQSDDKVRNEGQDDDNEIINIYWKELVPRTTEVKDETTGKVVEEETGSMRTFISFAKMIGNYVLEKHVYEYEHNSFMFRLTPFIQLPGEPIGLSLIDIFKDQVDTINRIEQSYIKNLQASAIMRFLVNNGANIDESELMDFSKHLVHGDVIHEGAVREFAVTPFSNQALTYKQGIVGSIKEFSGQLDVNIGQSSAGVTAASAIMALQDYGAKRNRLFNRRCYQDFRKEMRDTVFLMKEHYNTERVIRISAEARAVIEAQMKQLEATNGQEQIKEPVLISNNKRVSVDFSMLDLDNFDFDYDLEIIPQKKNAATSNLINSVVQQIASARPDFPGDLLIELLEVEGKDKIIRKYRERMGVEKQIKDMQQMMQQIAEQQKTVMSENEKYKKDNEKLVKQVMKEQFNVLRVQVMSKSVEGEDGPENAMQAISQLEQRQVSAVSGG